jgi:hypothetical protein
LAKRKTLQKWQRDPEGMRIRILEAAKQEFAAHGLAGARSTAIAANAGANKRMLYYHVGNKENLYPSRCSKGPMKKSVPRSAGSISNISIHPTRSSG